MSLDSKLSFEPKSKREGPALPAAKMIWYKIWDLRADIFGYHVTVPKGFVSTLIIDHQSKRPQMMDFRLLTTDMFGQGAIVHDL